MNQGPILFLGILLALATSWGAMVFGPYQQLSRQEPVLIEEINNTYPNARPGLAQRGQDVYRANGCQYCHTQQVRPLGFGADIERGWGRRLSVAQDYLYEQPVLLGQFRMGPDLANIGSRQTNEVWHLLHLYNPKLTVPRSVMPAYPYLFERRRPNKHTPQDAILIEGDELVPTAEGRALVAYLLSLQSESPLFEAPLPQPPKPPGVSTNEPSATNASPDQPQAAPATNRPAPTPTVP